MEPHRSAAHCRLSAHCFGSATEPIIPPFTRLIAESSRQHPCCYSEPHPDGYKNQDRTKILPRVFLFSDKSRPRPGLLANFARYWILGPTQGEAPASRRHRVLELAGVSC